MYKEVFNPIYKTPKTGKAHSLDYDNVNSNFAKYLRLNFYNVELSNLDVSMIKKEWEKSFLPQ